MKRLMIGFISIFLILVIITILYAGSTTSTKVNTSATGGSGGTDWANPSYAAGDNDQYAYNPTALGGYSDYIICTNYGFNIPSTATINGFELVVDTYEDASYNVRNRYAYLIDEGGMPSATNMAYSSVIGSTPGDTIHIGSSTWLGGLTWTPAEVNDPDMGCEVQFRNYNSGDDAALYVDCISIICYYTLSDGTKRQVIGMANTMRIFK